MSKDDRFVWIDLETSGLDTNVDKILSIGIIVTDTELNVTSSEVRYIWHPPAVFADMHPVVQRMHTNNGIINICKEVGGTIGDVEANMMNAILRGCPDPHAKRILAGSSVHFDRLFLKKYMPGIDRLLWYRHLDVSAIKTAVIAFNPDKRYHHKNEAAHTPIEDIKASIEELRYYQAEFFTKP